MEARLIAVEERLRQTEDVLIAERLARQTAEAAQDHSHSQLVLVLVVAARDLLDYQVLSIRRRLENHRRSVATLT